MQTAELPGTRDGINTASQILAAGGLVAFPTETVYGLGADACNDRAVAQIFAAKQRPNFNPLIIHVASVEIARMLAVWSPTADRLAQAFWPGPLTLVLPRQSQSTLSALATAELQSVAIRVPANPLAQQMLQCFGGPVAAPSANPSGLISPTCAAHVQRGLDGRIDAILNGGACTVGLESTIIGLVGVGLAGRPTLLRPGGLTTNDIEACLGKALAPHHPEDRPNAPGQMRSHYAPQATLRLNATHALTGETLLGFGAVPASLNLSPAGDLTEAAVNLFKHLHELDQHGVSAIAVSPIPETGLGRAINDRLKRAAAARPNTICLAKR